MSSNEAEEGAAPPREMTAAEKRAARRARVLQGGERRIKLVTGEIDSLKASDDPVEQAMAEGVEELLADATELLAESAKVMEKNPMDEESTDKTASIKIPPRVDPAQRRRDAQARRQKKEAMVEQILKGDAPSIDPIGQEETLPAEKIYAETVESIRKDLSSPTKPTEPAFSRHTTALRMKMVQEKLILVVIFGAALFIGLALDMRNISTDILANNRIFLSYQELLSKGVSVESIRQQMSRENLGPKLTAQMEHYFSSQRKSETAASVSSSYFPSVVDVHDFFTSLAVHPPIILAVLLVRLVIDFVGSTIHRVLQLPDVKSPQEEDFGMVLNLMFSSRPGIKTFVVTARKYVDDFLVFLWSFFLIVAVRAISEQ